MPKSVGQLFREKIPAHGTRPALFSKRNGVWETTSWTQFDRNVRAISLGLDALGLKKGDALAIIANSREEWTTLDRGKAPDRSSMKGAWWLPGKNTCRAATLGHGEVYFGKQVGVRCCADLP